MSSTPEGAHQALDGDVDIDGGVDATGGRIMPTEEASAFALTHTSSVCKKVHVDSGTMVILHKNTPRPPKNSDLAEEIRRRANVLSMKPGPRPSSWTQTLMMEWLEENPVSDTADDQFLTFEVLRLREISVRMQLEQQQFLTMDGLSVPGARGSGNWRGSIPYLRAIMTLTRDDVKSLFLSTRGNCLSRTQLDACNSDSRPQTVYELIADLWNSSEFNPKAPPSMCHSDFTSKIDCSHVIVVGLTPATAVKIADIFTSMRSKLLTVIKNWEASGQGDGGMDREQEEQEGEVLHDEHDENAESAAAFGSLSQRPARAL